MLSRSILVLSLCFAGFSQAGQLSYLTLSHGEVDNHAYSAVSYGLEFQPLSWRFMQVGGTLAKASTNNGATSDILAAATGKVGLQFGDELYTFRPYLSLGLGLDFWETTRDSDGNRISAVSDINIYSEYGIGAEFEFYEQAAFYVAITGMELASGSEKNTQFGVTFKF